MKAILLNSATKLPFWHKGRLPIDDDHLVPLDYIQGAGMLNAVGAFEHLSAGQHKPGNCPITGWDLNQLDKFSSGEAGSETLQRAGGQAPQNTYKITLTKSKDKFITVTTTWNKHYSNSYPFEPLPEKDSNLRLELWAVDLNDPNNDYLLDYSDSSIDNVEHIYVATDANYTNYEIVLSISDNEKEGVTETEQYGLAWNVSNKKNDDSIFWYDLNADGIVDKSDIAIMLDNFLTHNKLLPQMTGGQAESYLLGDIDTNGAIDINDLKILIDHNDLKADWYTE